VTQSRFWLGAAAILTASACSAVVSLLEPDRPQCVPEPRPAIAVFVRDATTQEWIASGATLVVRDGAFVDSASFPSGRSDLNPQGLWTPHSWGRAGLYEVRVRRSGYLNAHVPSVEVLKQDCAVVTRTFTVSLVPEPSQDVVARSP